jgi:zinc protease
MNLRRWVSAALTVFAVFVVPGSALAVDVQTLAAAKGEEVWYVTDHSLPMIAMSATLPAGSEYDPAGKAGLAAFAAALLDEGAGKLNAEAFKKAENDRGIQLSFQASRDGSTVSLVTLSANAQEAFRLLGLALAHPRFDDSAIARVRAQILAGLKQDSENPSTVAARGFFRTFFHGHPYGHSVSGDAASVAAITRADLVAFARTHWTRGNIKIAVSGDVDAITLKALVAAAFGALPDRVPPPVPMARDTGAPGVHVIAMDVPQPNVVFGLPGLLRRDKDFIPAYVANYILGGGGFSSRLMNDVREKRGLTYGISTSLVPMAKAGLWAGQVATKKASVRETIKVMRQTIRTFADNGPTAKELADAKTYLTGSLPLTFASNVGTASQLNVFQTENMPVDYVEKRNALINAVTPDDVKRVAGRLFDASRLTIVVAGSMAK